MTTTVTYADALSQFESELLTPIVPGELETWMDDLSAAGELMSAMLWRHTESLHNSDYPQIVQQDADLLGQVEQLIKGDAACLERLATVLDQIAKLKLLAPKCEPNEAMMRNSLDALVREGLAWVIDAKRQEKARDTWFAEAFYRDRGVGD